MDLNALKQAVLGANNVQAPAASPNSTGANAFTQAAIGHIQALSGISQRADASNFAGNALYGGVKQQAAADAAAEEQARQAAQAEAKRKLQELQQEAEDLANPSKYERVVNKSGGYDFFAPNGKKITAQDYAKVRGIHTTEAVKGSQNTLDQKFMEDYKTVQELGEQVNSGTLGAYLKKHSEIKKQLDSHGIDTYAGVVQNFRSSYPQYFSQDSVKNIGSSPNNNAPLQEDQGGLLDKLKRLFGG